MNNNKAISNLPPLYLYNSKTQKKEEFVPIDKNNITIYCCGPTLYGPLHIGNWRTFFLADLLVYLLRLKYGENSVTYIRNITDIDDKIFAKSREQNKTWQEVVQNAEQLMKKVKSPEPHTLTFQPRASEHIDKSISMIKTLLEKGYAYEAQGHVFFDISKYDDYGKLANRKPEEETAGSRVEINKLKKNYGDFVLWKPSKIDEPEWEAPWGKGRPGWHIECSSIIQHYMELKPDFAQSKKDQALLDIHIGGQDLLFPHHTNEAAQSYCHNKRDLASYWIHVGPVLFDGKKMSRSIGNTTDISQLSCIEKLIRRSYTKPLEASLIKKDHNLDIEFDLDYIKHKIQENPKCALPLFNNLNVELFAQNTIDQERLISQSNQTLDTKDCDDMLLALFALRNDARNAKHFQLSDLIRNLMEDIGLKLEDGENTTIALSSSHNQSNINESLKNITNEKLGEIINEAEKLGFDASGIKKLS